MEQSHKNNTKRSSAKTVAQIQDGDDPFAQAMVDALNRGVANSKPLFSEEEMLKMRKKYNIKKVR